MKKTISKLPFKKGSPLNFFYIMRIKRGLTQESFGKKIGRHGSAVCKYENGSGYIPEFLVMEIPLIFEFSNYEKGQFKKFLEAAEKRMQRNERGVGKKNHIVKGGWKKDISSKKTKKPVSSRKTGLSAEEKATIKFLSGFLNKRGGKKALNDLLKITKTLKRILA